jgi:hypothetical protein
VFRKGIKKEIKKEGEKPGLVVRAEGSRPRGRGLNPAVYWMVVSDANYFKSNEKKNKGSQMGHIKKIF